MTYIPDKLRDAVTQRASERCEYCHVHQDDRLFAHEIDHIYAEKHQGQTELDNLCLACSECNRYKGSDLCSYDTVTKSVFQLYHPRIDNWGTHFTLTNTTGEIESLTAKGRITVRLLRLNAPETIERRKLLIAQGRYN